MLMFLCFAFLFLFFLQQVNGTACAVPRMIMAIIENNQQEVKTTTLSYRVIRISPFLFGSSSVSDWRRCFQ